MKLLNKEYQSKAVNKLVADVSALLPLDAPNKVCVFQSPTGSGKTVMVAKFIESLIKENPSEDFCFLWVSIGKGELHKQSKASLDSIFQGFPKVNFLEQEFFGSRNTIDKNEVIVVNWEKIRNKESRTGLWKNKLMREGETLSFIEVLEQTKFIRGIILIIDESHYGSDAERTNELRQIISADITLEMSATPKITPQSIAEQLIDGSAKYVKVDPKEVIEAGMIKKELIINDGLEALSDDEKSSQDIILGAAYNKRIELKNKFSEHGAKVNPLCLIQLPNAEAGEAKREAIEQFLSDQGITEYNGKLAVWLSDDKSETLSDIASHESEVEFLVFKQAIDTGWDCPRAHILVKLRDIQSYTFEVQTVGRILRMPEHKHYDDESLNTGYIFTNLTSIVVQKEDYNPNIIKHLKATRKKTYKPLKLPSYYKSRADFGDITNSFRKVFDKVFCSEFEIDNSSLINTAEVAEKLKNKGFTTDVSAYKEELIVDKSISSTEVDSLSGTLEKETTVGFRLSDNDLQITFNQEIKANLNGFAPKRSIPSVRAAIYQWFKKYIGINYQHENGVIHIQYLFLHPKNREKFTLLLSKATGLYKPVKKAEVKDKIVENLYDWDVKFEEYYNQHSDYIVEQPLCIYDPCYLSNNRSNHEKEFEAHIETKTESIIWWFKNGVSKKDYFGIKYEENDLPRTFYPDYVIQLSSGKVFIGDTKAGSTAKEAALRAEALQAYIKAQNANGMDLIGGIIIKDPTGKWRVNMEETYTFDKNDLTNWGFFDENL